MSNDIPLNVKYGMEQCVYTSADGKKLNYCRRQFGNAGKDSAVVLFSTVQGNAAIIITVSLFMAHGK